MPDDEPVTVTTPAETGETVMLSPKLIVPAVPIGLSLSSIIIPLPDPTTPVSPEPSPTNEDAVTTPETLNWLK